MTYLSTIAFVLAAIICAIGAVAKLDNWPPVNLLCGAGFFACIALALWGLPGRAPPG